MLVEAEIIFDCSMGALFTILSGLFPSSGNCLLRLDGDTASFGDHSCGPAGDPQWKSVPAIPAVFLLWDLNDFLGDALWNLEGDVLYICTSV